MRDRAQTLDGRTNRGGLLMHPETTHLTCHRSCEACSAFTRVAARTLAPSPIRDLLHRRLQPFRYLHDCSGCFRLERLPGGACTHWKAPPCHGAHVLRTTAALDASTGRMQSSDRRRRDEQSCADSGGSTWNAKLGQSASVKFVMFRAALCDACGTSREAQLMDGLGAFLSTEAMAAVLSVSGVSPCVAASGRG